MPVLAERLVVRASTFDFDDVLVGAAARVLDSELGIHELPNHHHQQTTEEQQREHNPIPAVAGGAGRRRATRRRGWR